MDDALLELRAKYFYFFPTSASISKASIRKFTNQEEYQEFVDVLNNESNYIFLFDKIQTNKYKDQGINTVYHLPLGINVDRYKRIKPHSSKFKKYGTDISFVGNLYTGNTAGLKSLVSQRSANIIQ